MNRNPRIPRLFADFNAYINSTTDYLLALSGGTTNWERLGVTGSELNLWSGYRTTWNDLYSKYINLDLRTRLVKDDMRLLIKSYVAFAKKILERIAGAAQSVTADYEAFRIKRGILQDTTRTKHPAPHTHPVVLSINCMEPAKHFIRYKDELAEGRKKGEDASFCQIVYIVRIPDSPPDSVDDCKLSVNSSKTPAIITHSPADAGKMAFYFLRWVGPTGLVGPWSTMYHALIA